MDLRDFECKRHLNVCIVSLRDRYKPADVGRTVHSAHIWPHFSMQPWADIKACAPMQWMLNMSSARRSVLLALIQTNIDYFIYLILFAQGTIKRNRDSRVNGWFCPVCLSLVFSINHIQYGLINLIGGQLLFPSAPAPDLGRRVAEWERVWKGLKDSVVVWAAALCLFAAWQRLLALRRKSKATAKDGKTRERSWLSLVSGILRVFSWTLINSCLCAEVGSSGEQILCYCT